MFALVIRREKLLLDQDRVFQWVMNCKLRCYIVEPDCKESQVAFVVF